jgi:hypothetical protein
MITRTIASAALTLGFAATFGSTGALAQSHPEYIAGLPHGVKAVLYRPDSNPTPHTGVVVMHRTSNYLAHAACTQLSQRGLMVLCMNSRFDNNEALVNWELIAQDVGAGVNYLKNTQHMTHIVLFGHSGGGPTMSYYQAVAQNGSSYCQGPNKLTQCVSGTTGDGVDGLVPADGIVFADAHPGNGVNALQGMNPAVPDREDSEVVGLDSDNDPIRIDRQLDLSSPANGYNPAGNSNYSVAFQKRYTRAQADRMNDWIEKALHMRKEMADGRWRFPDDDSIIIARGSGSQAGGGSGANIYKPDVNVPTQCCTVRPEEVLQDSGAVTVQNYQSVRLPDSQSIIDNATFDSGSKNLTLTAFLSANAIRSTDSLDRNKIDWCSSNNSTPCALQHVTVPLLITGMGAYYFFPDGESYYLHYAASLDKEFIIAAGLVHGITPCGTCPGGPYTHQVTNYWNYVFNWIRTRFGT